MSNEEKEEEESRRRFLLRALFDSDEDYQEDQRRQDSLASASSPYNCNSALGRRKYSNIRRISQLDSWDCGIACLLMIAQWIRDGRNNDDDDEDCRTARMELERSKLLSAVGTESIWTSDLMRQLQSWKTKGNTTEWLPWRGSKRILNHGLFEESLAFVLASQQLMEADESYRSFQYYQNAFEEDQSRVARTFRDLVREKVPMLPTKTKNSVLARGLSLSTVIEIVEREDCLAIILLDNAVLRGTVSNSNSNTNTLATCSAPVDDKNSNSERIPRPPYAGHYVILCGTSDDPKHVLIANSGETVRCCHDDKDAVGRENEKESSTARKFCFVVCNPDPSSTTKISNYEFVTPERLESSWRAQGTDEDIIFLRNKKFMEPSNPTELRTKGWLLAHFSLFCRN